MPDLILAIDAGGTSVKVVLFDAKGNAIADKAADVETHHLPNGHVERDPIAFWAACARAIRQLLDATGAADKIAAVGCTGFGNGVFCIDESGAPTRPGIVSVDARAMPLVDELVASGRDMEISAITGHKLWGGQTLTQIAHFAKTDPEKFAATRWFLSCKDFIRQRLSNEIWTDPSEASGGGLMKLADGTYATKVFDLLGIKGLENNLPPLAQNSDIAGRVSAAAAAETGLRPGTPIAGSMMDVSACALGAGVVSADRLVMIAGTWSINGIEAQQFKAAEPPILNMVHRDAATRLLAEGSPTSAGNLSWYMEQALGNKFSLDEINALAAASPVTLESCYFLPFIHGPAPRRGAFLGLRALDDQGAMVRAIFEGVAFQHRRHAQDVLSHLGQSDLMTIRLAGGAARSAVWAQIFADVTGQTIEVSDALEVGALGAAICAAVAGGLHASLTEAAKAMTRVQHSYQPAPKTADLMNKRYQEFLRLDRGCADLFANPGSEN